MKIIIIYLISFNLWAYIPTVESLFRNGDNQETQGNTLYLNGTIFKIAPDQASEEILFYNRWIYQFSQNQKLKLSQQIYSQANLSDDSIIDKNYISNLNPYLFNESIPGQTKGLFYSILNSLLMNDGSFLIDFLRTKKIDIKHNISLVNQSKRSLLDRYKKYLSEKKVKEGPSPLEPNDYEERVKARNIMSEKLILDQGFVSLKKLNHEVVWYVDTLLFKAWISDTKREVRKIIYKLDSGDLELYPKEYFLIDGFHKFPRSLQIKMPNNDYYRIDFTDLRYFSETENAFLDRLKRADRVLNGKKLSYKPEFLF
jgi:hypothetical protein